MDELSWINAIKSMHNIKNQAEYVVCTFLCAAPTRDRGRSDIQSILNVLNGRSGEIRTPDPLLPKQVRYQAALRSADCENMPIATTASWPAAIGSGGFCPASRNL